MRILHLMSGAEKGGAETFFVDLTAALGQAGVTQRVVIRRNAARARQLQAHGLAPRELAFGRWFDFPSRRAIAAEIAAFKPDIVQSWMSRASDLCPTGNFLHVGWLGGYYDLKYFRRCDALVGVTRDLVEHVVKGGWPRDKAHYLPTFSANTPMPPVRRASLDTPEGAPLILALGRMHAEKGFDVLLKALVDVPEAYLWLAGEGAIRAELEALADRLGLAARVRFLGWRDDRAALFTSCDICVMPSRAEPFGTVMIEAWAYGRPVIAARAKGPVALIKDEENGLLVPIDDAGALTVSLKRLIDDAPFRRRIAEAGQRAYEAEYTQAQVVARHIDFYEGLLRRSAA